MPVTESGAGPGEYAGRLVPGVSDRAPGEPHDLGAEIAGAVLNAVRTVTERRGAAFEVAEPEPVLRGVISAFAAISQTLPRGLDEAWAQLGLLALELDDADPRTRAEDGGSLPS